MSVEDAKIKEADGFYKLNWLQRIGFGAGDLAQNFIFQTMGNFATFYYINVYVMGGDASNATKVAGLMLLIVRFVDVCWDPCVGAFVDKHHPKLGKYRSYLLFGGIPLTIASILCFWQPFPHSIVYAYLTYVILHMCYTFVNVPYGALNASLTRDTDEITVLVSTRMFLANMGGFLVNTGVPLLMNLMAKTAIPGQYILFQALGSLPSFIFLPLVPAIKKKIGKKNMFYLFLAVSIVGYAILYIVHRMDISKHFVLLQVGQFVKSTGFTVATGYMWALVPEVISYGEYTTGRRISGIVNALTGIFFKAGMALGGAIPGWVLFFTDYTPEGSSTTLPTKPSIWFATMAIYSILGLLILLFCFSQTKERVVMETKDSDDVRVSDLFKEFLRNRPLRVLALFFIVAFTALFVSNASGVYYNDEKLKFQPFSAQEGVRWCMCVIPSILMVVCMILIYLYELTDEKIDEINTEIEKRRKA